MKKKLKKQNFLQGAFFATSGIVISKILGILYVIPFYAMIGDQGGALYGYAYNIYAIFLGISNAGIPLAMSKVTSEYDALGYVDAKERTFKMGKLLLGSLGVICCLIMIIFARPLAYLIIGDVTGGNTIEDIALVIRLISLALLFVPVMSVYRGYLQGHKYFAPPSISQVLEQVIRVAIIIGGTYLCKEVFHLSLTTTVAIAVFSVVPSSLASYIYLRIKVNKNKEQFIKKDKKVREPAISNKEIAKLVMSYAIPFIMIEVFRSLYNSVDTFLLVKVLVNNIGYAAKDAEAVMGVISTWGTKINNIVIAVGTGVVSSLIPHISSSFIKGDMKDVESKINKSLQIVLYICLPMVIGLSMLSSPVWKIFYGNSTYGPSVYRMFSLVSIAVVLFTSTITCVQMLKDYKQVMITLVLGLLTNALLDVPLLLLFAKLNLPPYYGSILATLLGYSLSIIMSLIYLNKKHNISYKETASKLLRMFIPLVVMVLVLVLLSVLIPFNTNSRLISMLYVLGFASIGGLVYIVLCLKHKVLSEVLGEDFINNILKKLHLKRAN